MLRKGKSITGALAVEAKASHFVMDHIKAAHLNLLLLKQKKRKRFIYADAKKRETPLSVMAATKTNV